MISSKENPVLLPNPQPPGHSEPAQHTAVAQLLHLGDDELARIRPNFPYHK